MTSVTPSCGSYLYVLCRVKLVTGPSARVCGVNRKQFLITTGTAASGAAISLLLLRSNLNGALPPLQQPIFLAQMFDRETLRRIGVGYRNTHPEEDGVAQLTNLLGSAARTDSQSPLYWRCFGCKAIDTRRHKRRSLRNRGR